jgi:hypothetical protein
MVKKQVLTGKGKVSCEVGVLPSQAEIDVGGNLDGSRCSRKLDINVKELNVSDC